MAMTAHRLTQIGRRVTKTREAERVVALEARTAAIEAAAAGFNETEIANRLCVSRMTVRVWLGKR